MHPIPIPKLIACSCLIAVISGDANGKDDKPDSYPKDKESAENSGGHVFAWPFTDWREMRPRGGSTKGGDVELRTEPTEEWKGLREPGLEKFERDRRAILAMAGNFRASFDFVETLGFTENYKPPRPYFSWGTEHVTVLEDRDDFISLQHTLVMYYKDDQGETKGPHVMKHWRQDWTWQDQDLHVYDRDNTWVRHRPENPAGKWSQAVFQVDDSPRYEVLGAWDHTGGMSVWTSDPCPRPLPRREHTVRDDYNVLEGVHELTIVPNGWVHVQNNRKLRIDPHSSRLYVGQEIGVNRYEAISSPDLETAFRDYWDKTGGYWKAVRDTWAEVYRAHDRFTLRDPKDKAPLFTVHFAHAAKLEKQDEGDPAEDIRHARETIHGFLEPASRE